MITDYSARKLTYQSDRLPALAGLIAEFGRLFESDERQCLSGLWKMYLRRQLLWGQVELSFKAPGFSISPPDWVRYPSWSWACNGVAVEWFKHVLENTESRILCKIIPEESSTTHHALHIDGCPMGMNPWTDVESISANFNADGYPQRPVASFNQLQYTCMYKVDSWYLHQLWTNAADDHETFFDSLVESTVILPMMWDPSDGPYGGSSVRCLLLQRAPNVGKGVYRRVGLVFMEDTNFRQRGYGLSWSHLLNSVKICSNSSSDHDFLGRGDDDSFTIVLI